MMNECIYIPTRRQVQPCVDQGRNTHKNANYSIKTSVQCIDVVLTGIMDKSNYSAGYIFEMPIATNGGSKSMLSTAVSM